MQLLLRSPDRDYHSSADLSLHCRFVFDPDVCDPKRGVYSKFTFHRLYCSVVGRRVVFLACADAGPACDLNYNYHGAFRKG